jgi:DNA-binding transcriptional regulator GbsR (MarR family)
MSDVDAVRQAFIQLWGTMGPFWGISQATARVYSWLLARSEPADTDEVMAGLDLSRGAVSMACRELREWHLIVVDKGPGSRRVLYRPSTDLEQVIRNIISIRKRREWDPVLENLRQWIPRLDAAKDPEADIFRQRLEAIEQLVGLADSMVELFLKGGLVGRVGLKMLISATQIKGTSAPANAASERESAVPVVD